MARQHIGDAELSHAVQSYVADISKHCIRDGVGDTAVIVILAAPKGDGSFKVFAGGAQGGMPVNHEAASNILRSVQRSFAEGVGGVVPGSRIIVPGRTH